MRRRHAGLGIVVAGVAIGLAWALWPSPTALHPGASPDAVPSVPPDVAADAAAGGGVPSGAASSAAPAASPAEPVVRCTLPAVAVDAPEARVRGIPWLGPRRGRRELHDGAVDVPLVGRQGGAAAAGPGPFEGTLDVPGVGRLPITLARIGDAWSCRVGDLVAYGAVMGRVVLGHLDPDAHVEVFGCGTHTEVDGDGGFFLELPPEPCTLRASRRDGAFVVRSAAVEVRPGSGQELVLDLDLPPWKAAGVGTQIAEDPEGIRLERVFPDTPAARAGLRPGDVVVGLDGDDVAGIDADDFVDAAVGPAGSEVTYTVLRDGEEVDVTMTRAELAAPEP